MGLQCSCEFDALQPLLDDSDYEWASHQFEFGVEAVAKEGHTNQIVYWFYASENLVSPRRQLPHSILSFRLIFQQRESGGWQGGVNRVTPPWVELN